MQIGDEVRAAKGSVVRYTLPTGGGKKLAYTLETSSMKMVDGKEVEEIIETPVYTPIGKRYEVAFPLGIHIIDSENEIEAIKNTKVNFPITDIKGKLINKWVPKFKDCPLDTEKNSAKEMKDFMNLHKIPFILGENKMKLAGKIIQHFRNM